MSKLFEIIAATEADVICLQEMVRNILELLLEEEWVRKNYFISDSTGATFESYGVLLLSKFPINNLSLYPLPTKLGRKLLVADFVFNGQSFAVATSHLESYPQDAPMRIQQLAAIFEVLSEKNYDHAAFMGDFNFATAEERISLIGSQKKYHDLWLEINGESNPGFTFDTENNQMLSEMIKRKQRNRIDLIIFRSASEKWKASTVKLLGTTAISKSNGRTMFPSDHFGVHGSLLRKL